VKPLRPDRRAERSPIPNEGMSEADGEGVWEQVLERKNLLRALKRVEANGGAPGVDGMTVEALRPYLKAHPGPCAQDGLVGTKGRPRHGELPAKPSPAGGNRETRRRGKVIGDPDGGRSPHPTGDRTGVDAAVRAGLFTAQLRVSTRTPGA
jgi:hypothetical protein